MTGASPGARADHVACHHVNGVPGVCRRLTLAMRFCYTRRGFPTRSSSRSAFVSTTTAAFYLLAAFTVASALGVALSHNIVYSAFALMGDAARGGGRLRAAGGRLPRRGAAPGLRRRHPGAHPLRRHAHAPHRRRAACPTAPSGAASGAVLVGARADRAGAGRRCGATWIDEGPGATAAHHLRRRQRLPHRLRRCRSRSPRSCCWWR